jgi:hypothetical protein
MGGLDHAQDQEPRGGLAMLASAIRLDAAAALLGADGCPNPGTETGWSCTGPCSAALVSIELPGSTCDARACHCIHANLSRGGNAPTHLDPMKSERATSRMNSAVTYSKANRNFSAMTARGHGEHAPVSVELGGSCGRSGSDDCECDQREGTQTNFADHEILICGYFNAQH